MRDEAKFMVRQMTSLFVESLTDATLVFIRIFMYL
jgi:hypothetical protein